MKFSFGILAALAIFSVAFGVEDCKYACPYNYLPVCGYDGQHFKLFANKCLMTHEGCKAVSQYHEVKMQSCDHVTPNALKSCLRVCPLIYNPVCAFNGEQYQLFDNSCNLEVRNCEDNNQWRMAKISSCEPKATTKKSCLKPCPFIYAPICASNGDRMEIFDNSCVLEVRNCEENNKWRVTKMSACHENSEQRTECPRYCTLDFDPVCGSDGINYYTFGNMCRYETAKCRSNYSMRLVKIGACSKTN